MVEFVQKGSQTAIYKYRHINALATVQLTTSMGPLRNVMINTASAANGTLTIFDAATAAQALPANIIAVIDCTVVGEKGFDVIARNGIRFVSAVAVGDYTMAYY